MREVKLLGYRRFKSKGDKMYCVANVCYPFSDRDKENGCFGFKTEEIFMPDNLYDFLTDKCLNKSFVLYYDVVGQRAYLVDMKEKV